MDLNLDQVNRKAIENWKNSTTGESQPRKAKPTKSARTGNSRPPQVQLKHPRGGSCTQVIYSKKHGRYVEQTKESASANYGYTGGVNETSEISPEKLKQLESLDRMLASNNTVDSTPQVCRCGLKH